MVSEFGDSGVGLGVQGLSFEVSGFGWIASQWDLQSLDSPDA